MTSTVIMDLIAVAVLAGFLIVGAARGLFRSLAGLLIVVFALVGASFIANQFTQPVAAWAQPYIEQLLENRMDSVHAALNPNIGVEMPEAPVGDSELDSILNDALSPLDSISGEGGLLETFQIQRALDILGIDKDPAQSIIQKAEDKIQGTGTSVMSAVLESVAQTVIHVVLFALSFVVLSAVLKLLVRMIDKVLELPGLHMLNLLGGAAIGLIEGALLLFLAIWVMRRLGISFDTDAVSNTKIFQFFTTHTPLNALSFL